MNEPIFERALMRKRGQTACAAGKARDDHDMNEGASAIVDWQQGWDEAHALSMGDQAVAG
jgi:hypothetical protein